MALNRKTRQKIVGLSASFLLALMAEGVIAPVAHAEDAAPTDQVDLVEGGGLVSETENVSNPQIPEAMPVTVSEEVPKPASDAPATPSVEEEKAPEGATVTPKTEQATKPIDTNAVLETTESTPAPTTKAAAMTSSPTEATPQTLSEEKVFMSEKNQLAISFDTDKEKLTWAIAGLPEKTYDKSTGKFEGEQVLTLASNEWKDGKYTATIDIAALFGQDLSLRGKNNIRRTYRDYIGTYQLEARDADGKLVATKTLQLRPYENYETYEEMVAAVDQTVANHAKDRYVGLEVIGTSAEGRDIRMAIVAESKEDLKTYQDGLGTTMVKDPAAILKMLEDPNRQYKIPVLINNTHSDEQPGIDIVSGLFKDFATKDIINYKTTDKDGNAHDVTLNIKEALKHLILLFDFAENPDGAAANTRSLANGLDPNRDTGYQVNPETRAIATQISKWNPISLFDLHGFVKGFLIEPATPPHDPNFEYDLLSDTMLEQAHAMGRAGVANSKYTSYMIPKETWPSGWDDAFSGYTAVFAMYHGVLGHTIEIPEGNQASYLAGYHAVLAGLKYNIDNKDKLLSRKMEYFLRGLKKEENPKAEEPLVNPEGEVIGRPKGDKKNFFPDYYVIPMGLSKDSDNQQAFEMIEYFKRNGVDVKELTKDFAGYKKGDLVIDMAQAKRGYANHALYGGTDESAWPEMYAEVVMNFPMMRGFKSQALYDEADLFKDVLGQVTHMQAPRSQVDKAAPYYVIQNNSLSAIQAINDILKKGGKVYLTEDGYVVETSVFEENLKDFALYGTPVYGQKPVGVALKAMKVYAPGNPNAGLSFPSVSESHLAAGQMGFTLVDNVEDADVIILDTDQFDETILGKKPTIIIGGEAMKRLEELGVLPGFDAETVDESTSYEGLLKALVEKDVLSSGYKANDYFYSNSGSWIEKLPAAFRKLMSVEKGDFYLAGWWPKHAALEGKVMAIDGTYQDKPLFIYAGNPVNKLHTLYFYRWVSNAILRGELAAFQAITKDPELPNQQAEPGAKQMNFVPQKTVQVQVQSTLPATGEESHSALTVLGIAMAIGTGLFYFKTRHED